MTLPVRNPTELASTTTAPAVARRLAANGYRGNLLPVDRPQEVVVSWRVYQSDAYPL